MRFRHILCGVGLAVWALPADANLLQMPISTASNIVNSTPPNITPTLALLGTVLTCNSGAWTPAPTNSTYEFFRDGVTSVQGPIAQQTYTVVAADQGRQIICIQVASAGGSPATSPPSNTVIPSSCPEAATFKTAVAALPATLDNTHHIAYDTLICGLVADGVWAQLDALWVMTTNTVTGSPRAVADLNLVSPGNFTLTAVGDPVFTPDSGYTGGPDGNNTVYLDTGYNPSVHATHFTLGQGHLSAWAFDHYQSTGYAGIAGATNSSNGTTIIPWAVNSSRIADINASLSNMASTEPAGTSATSLVVTRSSINPGSVTQYRTGSITTITSGNAAAGGLPTTNLLILSAGLASTGGPYRVGVVSIGGFLTSTQVSSSGGLTGTGLTPRLCAFFIALGGICT